MKQHSACSSHWVIFPAFPKYSHNLQKSASLVSTMPRKGNWRHYTNRATDQGRNEGGKGVTIPRVPNHAGGRQMTAGDAEKSQQSHKYFLQYSTFATGRPQVRKWGRQTCFLPRAPSNLVAPLLLICCTVCAKATEGSDKSTFSKLYSLYLVA